VRAGTASERAISAKRIALAATLITRTPARARSTGGMAAHTAIIAPSAQGLNSVPVARTSQTSRTAPAPRRPCNAHGVAVDALVLRHNAQNAPPDRYAMGLLAAKIAPRGRFPVVKTPQRVHHAKPGIMRLPARQHVSPVGLAHFRWEVQANVCRASVLAAIRLPVSARQTRVRL